MKRIVRGEPSPPVEARDAVKAGEVLRRFALRLDRCLGVLEQIHHPFGEGELPEVLPVPAEDATLLPNLVRILGIQAQPEPGSQDAPQDAERGAPDRKDPPVMVPFAPDEDRARQPGVLLDASQEGGDGRLAAGDEVARHRLVIKVCVSGVLLPRIDLFERGDQEADPLLHGPYIQVFR